MIDSAAEAVSSSATKSGGPREHGTPGKNGSHGSAVRRPYRSESGPQTMIPVAKVMSEIEKVVCTAATVAPKSARTSGSAGKYRFVAIGPSAETAARWVLRDAMDLKGTKFGCGVAQCGACTVLLDGQPIRSCITPISAVGTRAVTTIESLPRDGSHPLQRAWLELDVPQCGYCQAGQLMSASALLKATPNPTDAQIDTAMSGNVCRCGTYVRIKQAIKSAANGGRRA